MENTKSLPEQMVGESARKRTFRYSSVSFTYYVALAFNTYLMVYLQSLGYNASQVGFVSGMNSVVGIFAAPFWGMMSDKIRSLKKVFIISLSVGSLLYAFVPLASRVYVLGISIMLVIIPIQSFFKDPAGQLLDSWMLRNATAENLNFGAIRAVGAFSFAVISFILGMVVPKIGIEYCFYALPFFVVPIFFFMAGIKGVEDRSGDKKKLKLKEMQLGKLFKNFYLITYLIFSMMQSMALMCSMSFKPYLLASIGVDPALMGYLSCTLALFQIPSMLLLKPLSRKLPFYIIVMGGSSLFIAEMILLSVAGSLAEVLLVQALHGLAGGISLTAGANYIFSMAPENLKATAQTLNMSCSSIAGIFGNMLGGLLIDRLGIQQFFLIAGFLVATGLLFFAGSLFVGMKVLKIKRKEAA